MPTRIGSPVRALHGVRGGGIRESRVPPLWRGQNMRYLPQVCARFLRAHLRTLLCFFQRTCRPVLVRIAPGKGSDLSEDRY